MGNLADKYKQIQTQVNVNLGPEPDKATDPAGYIAYHKQSRKNARLASHARKAVVDAPLSYEQATAAIREVYGQQDGDKWLENIKTSSSFATSMYNYINLHRELLDLDPALTQQQKERIRGSAHDCVRFMNGLAEKGMLPADVAEEYRHNLSAVIRNDIMKAETKERIAFLEAIEKIAPRQADAILSELDSYQDPVDLPQDQLLTYPYKEQIRALKEKTPTDPGRNADYQQILEFADAHLNIIREDVKKEYRSRETDSQSVEFGYGKKIVEGHENRYKDGVYNGLMDEISGYGGRLHVLKPEKVQAAEELMKEKIVLGDKTREGLRLIIEKMKQMDLLSYPHAPNGEDGGKIYGFNKLVVKKQALEKAIQEGDPDKVLAAGEEYRETYRDMQEIYAIAKSHFSADENYFPGNLDSIRNSAIPFEFAGDLKTAAQVNTVFLTYLALGKNADGLEAYLENPTGSVLENTLKKYEPYAYENMCVGLSFDDSLDFMTGKGKYESLDADFTIAKPWVGFGRAIAGPALLESDEGLLADNLTYVRKLTQYVNDFTDNGIIKHRYLMHSARDEKEQETKDATIANLLILSDEDRDLNRIFVGIPVTDVYGRPTGEAVFDAQEYLREKGADYENIIKRANKLIEKADPMQKNKRSSFDKADAMESVQKTYLQILTACEKDRGTPGYEKMRQALRQLSRKLPEFTDEARRRRMEQRYNAFDEEYSRRKYLDERSKALSDWRERRFQSFVDVYGPEGKMPDIKYEHPEQYDNLTIDIEGMLSEKQFANENERQAFEKKIRSELDPVAISAIVLGACMRPDRISYNMTNSSTVGDITVANQLRFTSDVMKKDGRAKAFGPVMIQARREAKDAIREYIMSGDPSGIRGMIGNLTDYAVSSSERPMAASGKNENKGTDPEKIGHMLADEMLDRKAFGITANPNMEIEQRRALSFKKQMHAMMVSDQEKLILAQQFDKMSPDAREELIGDMLFQAYVSNMAKAQMDGEDSRQSRAEKMTESFLSGYGLSLKMPTQAENDVPVRYDKTVDALVGAELQNVVARHTISDFDALLSEPEGEKKLRDLYMASIKKTDVYRKLTGAKTKEELVSGIMEADSVLQKGLTSIADVALPPASEPLNQKHKKALDREARQIHKKVLDRMYAIPAIAGEDVQKYGFSSVEPEGVKQSVQTVKDLYKMISDNNTWGGSKNGNYTNMLRELEKLKTLTQRLAGSGMSIGAADAQSYKDAVWKIDKLADKYLREKTDINSDYARRRVEGVKKLRKALRASIEPMRAAVDEMEAKAEKEVFGEYLKVYQKMSPGGEDNPFFGERYKAPESRLGAAHAQGQYKLSGNAGISVAIFAMAASGKYSFEQIMDPAQCRKEKEAMFAKVATAMQNITPENQKWIAEQIYKGQKATERMMNEQAKELNFSSPDLLQDKRFVMMLHMASNQFDAWQEMSHCQQEILELAQKDHPEMTKWEDYEQWWKERETPFAKINESINKLKSNVVSMATELSNLDAYTARVLVEKQKIKDMVAEIAKQKNKNPELPLHDCISFERNMEFLNYNSESVAKEIKKCLSPRIHDPKFAKSLVQDALDGTLSKNAVITFSSDPGKAKVQVTGILSAREQEILVDDREFLKETDKAIERLQQGGYTEKKKYLEDCGYAIFGQMKREFGDYPKDPKTGQRLSLKEFMDKQIKDKSFEQSLKKTQNPKVFKSSGKIAAMALNKEKLQKYVLKKNALAGNTESKKIQIGPAKNGQQKKEIPQKANKI